jgi:hypothetical protein
MLGRLFLALLLAGPAGAASLINHGPGPDDAVDDGSARDESADDGRGKSQSGDGARGRGESGKGRGRGEAGDAGSAADEAAEDPEPPPPPFKPGFEKAIVVLLGRADLAETKKLSFLSSLSRQGAALADYRVVARGSQPNFVALVSGSTRGVKDEENHDLEAPTIVDLLEKAGRSWKVYAQGYPGSCFLGARSERYVRKHNPLISFKSIQNAPARCANFVAANELAADLARNDLPDLSLFIPDIANNGDLGLGFADRWLEQAFGPLIEKLPRDAVLIVLFAEGRKSSRVYASLTGPMVRAGAVSKKRYDHYSLLKTLELAWGLGGLGGRDAAAEPIEGIWR